MPISISCPSCAGKLKAPDTAAGKKILCPKCQAAITVPGNTGAPPSARSAAEATPDAVVSHKQRPQEEIAPERVDDTTDCPFCGETILARAKKCKHCGEMVDVALRAAEEAKRDARRHTGRKGPERSMPNYAGMVLGMIGVVLLGVGFFTPVIGVPGTGINFIQLNTMPNIDDQERIIGLAILIGLGVAAVLAFGLAASRMYRPLIVTGLLALILIIAPVVRIIMRLNAEGKADKLGNVFSTFQWGWGVLIVGAILVMTAGCIPSKTKIRDEEEE